MKCINFSKTRYYSWLVITICVSNLLVSTLADPNLSKVNPYKNDQKAKHSLYREKDSVERMSVDTEGVPAPKTEYLIIIYLKQTSGS